MRAFASAVVMVVAGIALTPAAIEQEKGGQEEYGHYEVVPNWPQPLPDGPDGVKHEGWTWGSVGAVYAETPDRIWIAQRGELPLPEKAKPWTPYALLTPSRGSATGNTDGLSATCEPTAKRGWERRWHHSVIVVNRDGKLVQDWPFMEKMFSQTACGRGPHKIKMNPYDAAKHVWIIDDQQHVIWKFTYDGKLVMTLGTVGQRGRDAGRLFDRPTDIDWLPDGTFFISDGYGGTRVAKFDKDGKFIKDWGGPPKDPSKPGPNEFNTVHSIQISKDRRLFVVDRAHRRFQVFDTEGKFLDMFTTGVRSLPYAHLITTDQMLWVADGGTMRVVKYDLTGKYLYGWGGLGGQPGQLNGPHSLTVDQDGNLYLAEVFGGRVQKFRPKPGADRAKLVGQELRYPVKQS
jgi:sugar lactone lactonase YvrE